MRRIALLFLVSCSAEPDAVETKTPNPVAVATTVIDGEVWEGTVPPPEPLPEVVRPEPLGFPPDDAYTSHSEACLAITQDLAPKKWRKPVLDWCEHRSNAATRYTKIVSKVDGSQIHDRDRPTAWRFYNNGVARETLDPEHCPFHRLNPKQKRHPASCVKLRRHWPWKDVRLPEKMRAAWQGHSHDAERFGARGRHDWNANVYNHIKGCWDPAQLDRFDVSITATVLATLKICEEHGCRTKHDIWDHWGRRG